tara:strand:+ start:34 stop:990 length:957 start_codon:yes stop_codon:yes gene_type:complete
MSILITGGAGYIGSVIAWELNALNEDVVILDDLSWHSAEPDSLPGVFVKGSFLDQNCLDQIFQKYSIDTVCHLGALANITDSIQNPIATYEINTAGTINLLDSMRRNKVRNIIFSSTAAVYGDSNEPFKEKDNLNPINPYGKSKLFAEKIISDCAMGSDLSFISFRYFCVAGATSKAGENREEENHLIPKVVDHFLGQLNEISIFGNNFLTDDGTAIRDFIHVLDISRAHIIGINHLRKNHERLVVNLGSNKGYSVQEVITTAEKVFKQKAKVLIADIRDGDPAVLCADNGLAKIKIGWSPKYTLEQMIQSTGEWRKA